MGPAGVALTIEDPWVLGALMNNQWSFAGWGDKAVNAMVLQPFVNYNLPAGWYLTTSPIVTADWKADKAGDVWTVPLGGGVGKLFRGGHAAYQRSTCRLRQRGQAGVWSGLATAVPDTVPVSEMRMSDENLLSVPVVGSQ